MKKLSVFIVFLLMSGVSIAQSAVVKLQTSAQCTMCKNRIEKNLYLSKGVEKADLNLEDKIIEVKYNTKKTNPKKIKEQISKTGYDVEDMMADAKAYNALPSCCKKKGHTGCSHSN